MATDIFGPIFSAALLEKAAIDTLKDWMPTYIQELEIQTGSPRGMIPPPRSYTTKNEFTRWPEDQLPACVVISPGLVGEPMMEGDGSYRAWWGLGIGIVASATTDDTSNFAAKLYGAAVRAIMLHKQSLGGISSGVEWLDEMYDDIIDTDEERTVRGVVLMFQVLIDDVVVRSRGPAEQIPPDDAAETLPGSDWPTAELVEVDIVKEELGDQI